MIKIHMYEYIGAQAEPSLFTGLVCKTSQFICNDESFRRTVVQKRPRKVRHHFFLQGSFAKETLQSV